MRERNAQTKFMISLKTLIAFTAMVWAVAACTKHKEMQNKVTSDPYLAKSDLQGRQFYLVRGIEEADGDNTEMAVPGFSQDYGLVKVEITEKELRFLSAFDPSGRSDLPKVIASYPITGHFDIIREKNDFNEETNKIVEDTTRSWDQRAYMRVDWIHPTNSLSKFTAQIDSSGDVKEVNTVLVEGLKNENGHLSFVVETGLEGEQLGKLIPPFGEENVAPFRIRYRTHLMPAKATAEFKPVPYSLKDFGRFGYFVTQQDFKDPEKGFLESKFKTYANVFNVCEAGRGDACSRNQVKWVLSKNFPDQYLKPARDAVKAWNTTFQKALGRTDDVIVLDESIKVDLSDPRHNVIAYYDPDATGSLLGVAQGVTDPRTGEKVSARATIYGAGIRYELGRLDTMLDIIDAGDDALSKVIGVEALGPSADHSPLLKAETLQAYNMNRRMLGLKNGQGLGVNAFDLFGLRAGADQVGGFKSRASDPAFLKGTSISTTRKRSLMKLAPDLFNVPEIARIGGLQDLQTGLPASSPSLQFKEMGGMERLLMFQDSVKADKERFLLQSEKGVHGSEMVDMAVVNYLAKRAQASGMQSLKSQKDQIKAEVANLVFYTTLLHEMGHTFGLRHNFMGSADRYNYYPEYYSLKTRRDAGDKTVSESELAGFSFSSIMDYGGDFYEQMGGLGPYDNAAIKYAYNRSLDRDNNELLKRNFMFCTDHQVGEDLRCRQFDRGSTATEIVQNVIDSYHRMWALRHFRRDRANFERSDRRATLNVLLSRTFVPVRQAMDEFTYALITDRGVSGATNGSCPVEFWKISIDRKEMANVCDPAAADQVGVNSNDMSTFANALYNPQTGRFFVEDASKLTPYGLADLLRANVLAQNFFQEVLGTIEPGNYLAIQSEDDKKPARLLEFDRNGSVEDQLKQLGAANGVSEAQMPKFLEIYGPRVVSIGISASARPYDSTMAEEGTFQRLQNIGSFWDKYLALIALSSTDIGVRKYAKINMGGSAYLYPHTKPFVNAIFDHVIRHDGALIAIPVTLKDGKTIWAQSDLKVDDALSRMAIASSLSDLVSDADMSMLSKLRICVAGDRKCGNALGAETVEAVGSNGVSYVAVQTVNGDSIAVSLLQSMKEISEKRAAAITAAKKPVKTAEESLKELATVEETRARLIKVLSSSPELSSLLKFVGPADPKGDDHGVARLERVLRSADKMGPSALASEISKVQADFKSIKTVLQAQTLEANPTSEEAKLMASIVKDMMQVIGVADKVAADFVDPRVSPEMVRRLTKRLESQESTVEMIRSIMATAGHD